MNPFAAAAADRPVPVHPVLASLHTADGLPTAALLEAVQVDAHLDGLMLRVQVEQRFRHTGDQPLELVHVFPLPAGAVLLGLDVTLGDRRLPGTVVARREAEAGYERAMDAGDTPVLVEALCDGRWRTHLGNLAPGDTATLSLRYGQLARFEQGQVRLAFPSTIAPLYGEPATGDPLPLVPPRSLLVEHPLRFTLALHGEMAACEVACPTHPVRLLPTAPGGADGPLLRLSLAESARLDRDVVFTIHPRDVASVSVAAVDPGGMTDVGGETGATCTVLASFRPHRRAAAREQLDLKVLVDCSGSMAGERIASARQALLALADSLRPSDRVSYSRFGGTCEHDLRRLVRATPSNLERLRACIARTVADLGGTEMHAALTSVMRDLPVVDPPGPVDILLITDGDVWGREELEALARGGGHRIFAVGVGSSPHESLLRTLAEATGGACEFATPGESLREAVARTMARMRGAPVSGALALAATVDGRPVAPLWATPLPRAAFDGDTLHVFAAFPSSAGAVGHRLALSLVEGDTDAAPIAQTVGPWPTEAANAARPPELARLAAWHRLQAMPADAGPAALALALRHQLVTSATRLLCVHERAADDKVQDFAALHVEPAMLAAGWGGTGATAADRSIVDARITSRLAAPAAVTGAAVADLCAPSAWPTRSAPTRAYLARSRDSDVESMLSRPAAPPVMTVPEWMERLLAGLGRGESFASLTRLLDEGGCPPMCMALVIKLFHVGMDRPSALALMLRVWLDQTGRAVDEAVEAAIGPHLDGVTQRQWQLALEPLDTRDALALWARRLRS